MDELQNTESAVEPANKVSPVQSHAAKVQATVDMNLAAAEARQKLTDSVKEKRKQTAIVTAIGEMSTEQRQELMDQIDEKYQSGELPSEPGQEFQPEPDPAALEPDPAALEPDPAAHEPDPAASEPEPEWSAIIATVVMIDEKILAITDVMCDVVMELRNITEVLKK